MQARDAGQEHNTRLRWMVQLRWLAVAGIIGLGLYADRVLDFTIPVRWLVVLAVVVAGYNLVFRLLLRTDVLLGARQATLLAHAQIAADLVALTVLVHLTGGIENPFAAYYVFHMIIASIVMPRRAALAYATFACLLFGTVIALESQDLIHHVHLPLIAPPGLYRSHLIWPLFAVWASVLYGAIYLAGSVSARLRQRERELAQLTAELSEVAQGRQETLERLQDAQKLQLRYMRKVSHELRSPLAAAVTLIKVATDALGDKTPDKLQHMFQRAIARLNQGLDMVRDLLALSQSREAPLAEEVTTVDVAQLLEMVVDMEMERAQQKEINLLTDIARGLPPVEGQQEALAAALANLVSNAIRYSPTGSDVRIQASSAGQQVVIAITDHGQGIAEEDLPHIFDEFYRTSEAKQVAVEGTGLGLSIVKSVVDTHGGRIEVDSKPGRGSTFTIYLPTAPA